MIYKKFYINIVVRVVLLLATCFLITFSFPTQKAFLIINHLALLIIQIILLVRYLNKTNYELADFFESVVNKDYNFLQFSKKKGKSYSKLYESLTVISDALKKSEIENIFKSQYLLAAIENVGTGLIWFDDKGNVLLVNKSTRELLSISTLSNISELDYVMKGFSQIINEIKPSENRLIKLYIGDDYRQISIKSTELIQQGKHIKLISLQDIKNELDEVELDSWQKLIRVLAHEIMNSIGPITTTTTAILRYFRNDQGMTIDLNNIDKTTIDNTIKGLEIIEDRSVGLKEFVSNYRQLTNLPKPIISEIKLNSFVENISLLFKEEFLDRNIDFNYVVEPKDKSLSADEKLISHVIINLLKNSIEAVRSIKKPKIDLKVFENKNNEIVIQVRDNGPGIPEEIIDKIFIPFFTAKEEGSGIGLSLSRQIMRLHNGSIKVKSSKGGTDFQLIF
ncbi:MAG: GHKL domain-containing protein [Bacteroidales bacterium]|nr:GHKL domain-containing protein [Bacteroidales bacterium]